MTNTFSNAYSVSLKMKHLSEMLTVRVLDINCCEQMTRPGLLHFQFDGLITAAVSL